MHTQKTLFSFFTPDSKEEKTDATIEERKISNIHKSEKRAFMRTENSKSYDKTHQWNGYLFVATNNFREYLVVNTTPKIHKKRRIILPAGSKVATATVDDDSALTNIEVDQNFRRQGIGTELIRFIKNACPKFIVFGGTESNSRYRLTAEGNALVAHCRRNNILKADQVILDCPASPSYQY